MWVWNLPELPLFENIMSSKVSKIYDWHSIETNALVNSIIEKRNEKKMPKKFATDRASILNSEWLSHFFKLMFK